MSVGKSSFGYAPYYNFDLVDATNKGLHLADIRAGASSPTMAILAGTDSASARSMAKTTDGISWTAITSSPNTAIFGMAYGNGVFVAVGAAGVIYTSPGTDGTTWTARTKFGASAANFYCVRWDGTYFWAVQQGANVQKSTDGITWTDTFFTNEAIGALIYTDLDADMRGGSAFSFLSRGGVTIGFAGRTGTVSSTFRIVIGASTATSGGVAISTSVMYLFGDQDGLGMGNGPAIFGTSTVTYADYFTNFLTFPFNRIVGLSTASTNFSQTTFGGSTNQNIIFPTGWTTALVSNQLSIADNYGARKPTVYSDGWFSSVYLGSIRSKSGVTSYPDNEAGFSNNSEVQALISMVWKDGELVPYNANMVPTRVIPRIMRYFGSNFYSALKHSIDISLPGKKMWVLPTTNVVLSNIGSLPIFVLRASRAFRPIKTTIDF